MDKEKEIEIDIVSILYAIKSKIVYIILSTLILATLSGCITEFLIKPQYSTSCTMYVYSNTDRVSTDSSIGASELDASKQLVNTYIVILKSDNVLEKVIEELNLDAKAEDIRKLISCQQIDETEVFQVTVKSKDAVLSTNIANAIAQVAPEEIVRVVKAGGVEVVDYAKVPEKPSSPNLIKNIILGAAVGFILSFAAFFIMAMFDTTITSEKDLEKEFEIPILGTVPRLLPMERNANSNTTDADAEYFKTGNVTKKGDE